jgi:hypothetical protein
MFLERNDEPPMDPHMFDSFGSALVSVAVIIFILGVVVGFGGFLLWMFFH